MSQVVEILEDVKVQLQSIAALNDYVVHVLSEDDFLEKIRLAQSSCAGVLYEGLRPKPEGDKPSHRVGLMADLNIMIVLAMPGKIPMGGDLRASALGMLDAIRNTLKDTKSKSGHSWRFMLEGPAAEKNGYTMWFQRWSTPVPLTK